MRLQLIRHATLNLQYAGLNFLIDPMFSEAGVNPPINNSANDRRNPLVPLPMKLEILLNPDAVLVTHVHQDHWDEAAAAALPKATPILCQPGNEETISSSGFTDVTAIESVTAFKHVNIIRTGGQHGRGEIGRKMGRVSGFILQADGQPTVYIAGDTIWCDDVVQALDAYRPDVTIVNAGGARFAAGDPITMDADDVVSLCQHAAYTKVVAVHMDAINHCLTTRADLRNRLSHEGWLDQVSIPEDGDGFEYNG
ncbi:MBL fold metallo-hydrolase [Paenibacillus solisilvae]|uniref:MBL fold metallo-hydrolase n=1 Tax=Paenibacillus solisilvae TaxID=2486751 RepID=A0ABW0VTV5_9BACL